SPYQSTATVTVNGLSRQINTVWTILPAINLSVPLSQIALLHVGDTVQVGPITAVDGEQRTAVIGVPNLPAGLSFDPVTATIIGPVSISAAGHGPYHVVVTANDGLETVTSTFDWNATGITFTRVPIRADQVGTNVNLPIHATNITGGTITYSAT